MVNFNKSSPLFTLNTPMQEREFVLQNLHNKSFFKEYAPTIDRQRKSKKKETSKSCRWKPPPQGKLKLNVDAAIDSKREKLGIRKEKLRVGNANFPGDYSPTMAELVALKRAISWSIAQGVPVSYIETNSKEIVDKINNNLKDLSPMDDVIVFIKNSLSITPSVSSTLVRREGNTIAKKALVLLDIKQANYTA
ncbi:hypothetical protein G4B88_012121 [Cannabis sativa]|uniref:RNase H type-1 domain-containing protein n=1 Tax=Cannabis sativa TaxID=3483 RepID=A0A7J6F3S3_CANSA|nr:hypothetical protein G4B88_012121 [Cannabis sativa]